MNTSTKKILITWLSRIFIRHSNVKMFREEGKINLKNYKTKGSPAIEFNLWYIYYLKYK